MILDGDLLGTLYTVWLLLLAHWGHHYRGTVENIRKFRMNCKKCHNRSLISHVSHTQSIFPPTLAKLWNIQLRAIDDEKDSVRQKCATCSMLLVAKKSSWTETRNFIPIGDEKKTLPGRNVQLASCTWRGKSNYAMGKYLFYISMNTLAIYLSKEIHIGRFFFILQRPLWLAQEFCSNVQ